MNTLIVIILFIFLGCSKETTIEENKCECEIHTIEVTYDVYTNTTRVRHYYEPTDITDCGFDGIEINEGTLECK